MILSFELIYYGDCNDMIQFYSAIFDNSVAKVQTYAEMPMAELFGIQESELGMVWRGSLEIRFGSYAVRFKLSDSMVIARRETVGYMGQAYNPLICIEHPDEQYVRNLFEKLYCGEQGFEDIQKGTCVDKYGMRWIFKKSDRCGIYQCLEFKGNCREVAGYVSDAYKVNITEVVEYKDSPYADMISPGAEDKIYEALMEFPGEDYIYAIKYADSPEYVIDNLSGNRPENKLWYQIIIVVEDPDEKHVVESFHNLSVGATLNRPISPDGDGRLYGSMIDRYGFVWEVFGSCG